MFTHKTGVSISFEVDGIKLQSSQLMGKHVAILLDVHIHVD